MAKVEPVKAASPARVLTGRDKAAALLLAMGKPFANRVLAHFEEDEIKSVAESAAALGTVPRGLVEDLISEFTAEVDLGPDLHATSVEIEQLLSGLVPPAILAKIMQDLAGGDNRAVWQRLSQMPETPVAQYLMKEHPQVAAFILSKATSVLAASVLEVMPSEVRSDLMRRMLSMKHVMEAPIAMIETALHEELLHKGASKSGENVHARIADIINRMKREHMDEVFASLNEYRPKEAEKVKGLLFTFEDVAKLRPEAIAKLFDSVPPERVILALFQADKGLTDLILAGLGSRSRRMIETELSSGATPPARDVLKARRAIADLALELSEKGLIDIHADEV
jgi:flagellar motor switch protein FliG